MENILLECKNIFKAQLRGIYDGERKYLRDHKSVIKGNLNYDPAQFENK